MLLIKKGGIFLNNRHKKGVFMLTVLLFLASCTQKKEQLEVFSIPISNGEVSVENFNIISTKGQIYIEDNYYLKFQDENIKSINFGIYDKESKLIYSFAQNVDFFRDTDKIEENTGFIIDSSHFRTGDEIKIEVNYTYSDGTKKSFTSNEKLENENE